MANKVIKFMEMIILILIIIVAIIIMFLPDKDISKKQKEVKDNTILYEGKKYELNRDIVPLLFLGIDKSELVEADGEVGINGRADTVLLILLDKKDKTIKLLSIPRDTLMSIDIYSDSGKYLYSGDGQINMQYAFGEDDRESCSLMRKKVSELLYDIDINKSLGMTMGGIGLVVDGLGGIKVTMEEDYTEISPSYTKGATILMDGKQAEQFVRWRDVEILGSNEQRMDRQTVFVKSFLKKIKEIDVNRLNEVFEAGEDKIITNMSLEMLDELTEYQFTEEVYKIPGGSREPTVTAYDEYILDEEQLKVMIINLFYKMVED